MLTLLNRTVCVWLFVALVPVGAASRTLTPVIWHDPGRVETLDLAGGPLGRRGAPKPPFLFLEEELAGSSAKVKVRDARGTEWSVKFGDEVHSDTFASRIAWAAGYYVEPTYFVRQGVITGAHGLKRAEHAIGRDGRFENARFQLRSSYPKYVKSETWSWRANPFVGSSQLAGLKIIVMLTSNWDNKDSRDAYRDSNTGLFVAQHKLLYAITDWGASMGAWGRVYSRSKWDCASFLDQTPHFVEGTHDGMVNWGYHGQHTPDAVKDISVNDVRWLLRYLGRIRDGQIKQALIASGATSLETECFTVALRRRINELERVAGIRRSPRPVPAAAQAESFRGK